MNTFSKYIVLIAIAVAAIGAILPSVSPASILGTPTGGWGVSAPDAPTAPGGMTSMPAGGWGTKAK